MVYSYAPSVFWEFNLNLLRIRTFRTLSALARSCTLVFILRNLKPVANTQTPGGAE